MHKNMTGMMTSMQQGWSWKEEPASPPPLSDLDTDNWFTISNGDYSLVASDSESSIIVPDSIEVIEEKPLTRAETATRLLNDLDEWIKEEPFSDWYEEKIDLPIFEELETVPQLPSAPSTVKDVPVYNCKEFIDICSYQSNVHGIENKVAPPLVQNIPVVVSVPAQQHQTVPHIHQSPHVQQIIAPPAQMGEHTSSLMQEFEFVFNQQDTLTPPESPREDGMCLTMLQDMHTEELDELVRIRVESLVEGADNSCSSSLHEDSSADSPASSDSGYDDPDWMPEPLDSELKPMKRRRPSKPYARPPPEEKRLRKKEQNKNAATRYRQKKKAEIEEILEEERELQDTNAKLKTDLSELAREIKYLKNLMRDVFKAKGLIK